MSTYKQMLNYALGKTKLEEDEVLHLGNDTFYSSTKLVLGFTKVDDEYLIVCKEDGEITLLDFKQLPNKDISYMFTGVGCIVDNIENNFYEFKSIDRI